VIIKKTKMDKNTKLILGVGVLAAAGYLIWKQGQKPKASFVSRMAPSRFKVVETCVGTTGQQVTIGGNAYWDCCQMGFVTPNKPDKGCGPTPTQA
jgi:hypothetical protein